VPRYEVGAQFDFNRLSGIGESGGGFGGRFDFNFDDHFALDAELTHRQHILLPTTGLPPSPIIGQTNGLFGLRVGQRVYNGGVFAHARAGFVHFGTSDGVSLLSRRTFTAAEFGGTFETYMGPVILRLDLGESIVAYGNAQVTANSLGPPPTLGPLGTRASPIVGLGFAFRF